MTEIMLERAPADWPIKRLGQLFRERKEKVNDRDFPPLSVTKKGILPQLETAAKSDDGDNRKGVRAGDFVINSRSDRKGSGGLSWLDGSVSLISIVLEPRGAIEPRFAHHLLRSRAFQEEFYRWGHGIVADLWTTRYSEMKNILLAVPDIETQKAIADFLDRETARIDQLIEKKLRLVELLGERRQRIIDQLSTKGLHGAEENRKETGLDWLGQIPSHWTVEKLAWHFTAEKGRDAQKYTKEYCDRFPGPYPVFSGQTANEGVMGTIDSFDYDYGEQGVLFSTTVGAKAMTVAHLTGKFSLSQNCMIIVPISKTLPIRYFYYLLQTLFRKERSLIPEHMQASFRVEDLHRYWIARPPNDEAKKIAEAIDTKIAALDAVQEKVQASIERLREFRSALITAAVVGQIDVTTPGKRRQAEQGLDQIEEAGRA